ncbi:hypothetical protein TIFTF001_032543 [Ficus carica]|uniref:Uncharacterized protein n=1 Tax=Ficus carica TaxID=3494 RepID=A0AA88E0J4_FICCA|nr:hypothetical protein TIFTF001_032543 [Ficus carica]
MRICKEGHYPGKGVNRTGQVQPHLTSGTSHLTNTAESEHIIHTIFGGTATGDTTSSRRSYARDARHVARGGYINMAEQIVKISRQDNVLITFTDGEDNKLFRPHNVALVGETYITNYTVRRVLINNGSSANILLMDAFTRLKIGGTILAPVQTQLYRFVGECVRAAGLICLSITIGDGQEKTTRIVEFLVVNKPSVYNVIFGRPTLNAPKAVVLTYHLAMKFPTPNGVRIFKRNQERARKFYVEVVNKVCHKVL